MLIWTINRLIILCVVRDGGALDTILTNESRRRAFVGKCLSSPLTSSSISPTFPQPNRLNHTTATMSDDSSDLSDLSSVPSNDEIELKKKDGILKFFSKVPKPKATPKAEIDASPPRPKRQPSPPHEYVLADNPDIAVCFVAFSTALHVQNALLCP